MHAPAALLLIALLYYLPELMVAAVGGSMAAWFFVVNHVQTAALWCVAARAAEDRAQHEPDTGRLYLLPTLAVCCYGLFEAIQSPICRLAFPMDHAPPKHPEGVCGAAGLPTYELSPLLIALCAVLLARTLQTFTGAQTRRV